MNLDEVLKRARRWARERDDIMSREEMSGRWADEIQASDDDAAEIVRLFVEVLICKEES